VVVEVKFNTLEKSCISCTKCSLSKGRTNVVFGRGNPKAKIFIIGEGPGQQEDEQGLAFVGRAGKMLNKSFLSVGIDTNEDCYISNIVKCRPPNNRKPKSIEVENCIPWLNSQIELVKPKIIVLAGSTAVQSYLNINQPISKIRGKWITKESIKYMPIFHPSYLLRNSSNEKGKPKWLTIQDLKKVKQELNSV
jgi:DNA polymerase|tara:strand:- start:1000 stop:1578 length:579 start_codon:yes stop_codon:yes gene_type:complete